MFVLLIVVHIVVALALILVVLLQVGKGQSIGAAFGGAGSSQTFFGSRGPATFLSHMTTVAAAVFMLTSLGLAYLSSGGRQRSSIIQHAPPATERMPPAVAPAPDAPGAPAIPDTPAGTPPATESAPPGTESTPAQPAQPLPAGTAGEKQGAVVTPPAPAVSDSTPPTPTAAPVPSATPAVPTEAAPPPAGPSSGEQR
jgi:preprotein translocase subunit SecG